MKKIFNILLVAFTATLLTACGGGGDDSPAPTPTPNPPTPIKPEYPTYNAPTWQNDLSKLDTKDLDDMSAYVSLPDSLKGSINANDQIAVFCGTQVRGSLTYVNTNTWMGLVYGKAGDMLTVKYYSAKTKHMHSTVTPMPFIADGRIGTSVDAPLALPLVINTK